ncbi:MAG TPA: hypothetical protein ENK33_02355 [Desulfobacterales bacterium]|nr:hypothetical protein [Desulfobacterales bacterium]
MLVPIELYCLAQKKGYLSPDLAIGWQIGKYVAEFFDGLRDVKIAVAAEGDAALSLSYLSRGAAGQIRISEVFRPWDFLFYHTITGTVLNFTLIRKYIELPRDLRSLEPDLAIEKAAALRKYRAGLDSLVVNILKQPADCFSVISEVRCRPLLRKSNDNGTILCWHCGRLVPFSQAFDIEGRICCQDCSSLEPEWFEYINGKQTGSRQVAGGACD